MSVRPLSHVSAALGALALALPVGVSAQDDSFSLDGLIVTVSPMPVDRDAVSNAVTVLEGASLRARGLGTVEDALRGVAGVDLVRNGSFGSVTSLFMRGGESDYVLVLVDGVQVNQPGGAFDFSSLTLANVERIEVVRGPASALYGSDAVAGVVHVLTRSGGGAIGAEATTRVGTYGRADWAVSVAGGGERAGYSLSATRLTTAGIHAFNNDFENSVLDGRARFAPSARTQADLSFRVGDRVVHTPTDGSGAPLDRNAFSFGDEALARLALEQRIGGRLAVRAMFGISDVDSGYDDAPDSPADSLGFFGSTSLDHLRRSTTELHGSWIARDLSVTAGLEVEEERQRSFNETLSQFGDSGGRSEYSRRNRGYYTHVRFDRGRVSLDGGARLDDNERFGAFTTWQLGGVWRAGRGLRFRANAGSAIKEPTFFETFATGFARGNPDLTPERSRSWEVGAEADLLDRRLRMVASWFDQRFRDLIQFTFAPPNPGGPNYYNVAEAASRGAELEATVDLWGAEARAAWMWLDTEALDAGFDEGASASFVEGEPLLRRPRHRIRLGASVPFGDRVRAFADASLVGRRSDRDFATFPATPVELEAYTDIALGAELIVVRSDDAGIGFDLTLRAENVLDQDTQEAFGFRTPGRAFYLGGRLSLGAR